MEEKANEKSKKTSKKDKLISVICGVLAGACNGLFGGGGGMIVVPMLTRLLNKPQKKAHATAILIILPMSIISGLFYAIFGSYNLSIGVPVGIGVIAGGIIGAKLLKKSPNKTVKIIFAMVMLIAGIKLLFF